MSEVQKHSDEGYSVIPPSGSLGTQWPSKHNIPQGKAGSLSTGGWTADSLTNRGNEGFYQQSFLGASIRSFNINAGFGDTTSTLSVQLVNDEYHLSDSTGFGRGDDPYHSGVWAGYTTDDRGNTVPAPGGDTFRPPVVGTPVYFKFGKNPATISQAYRQTWDDLYGMDTIGKDPVPLFPEYPWDEDDFKNLPAYNFVDLPNKKRLDKTRLWKPQGKIQGYLRGRKHFVFGGILQSYTQNESNQGNPLYSVNVNDPREILSNAILIFNNYQGTTYNNKNLFNIYGFLEYDPSDKMARFLNLHPNIKGKGIVRKNVDAQGIVSYAGFSDPDFFEKYGMFAPEPSVMVVPTVGPFNAPLPPVKINLLDQFYFGKQQFGPDVLPEYFPITGQGFSRRSDKGMPFYRISQGIAALFQMYGFLPKEYADAGFGGTINFRGYNYVVDFGGIPVEKIPLNYYMDFDQLDILSFAQELCDIISHELYVSLLPVIEDHPACKFLYEYNTMMIERKQPENVIAGVIRLDAIDKTEQPMYGAIKQYLENLDKRGISVENKDVGFELSNVTTDKFVVGGQQVNMHYFHNNKDRDDLEARKNKRGLLNNLEVKTQKQWGLESSLSQQILPFYGFLGKKAVTIPKGFGSYQQILLDSSSLDAFGVGNYYVATEMELRAALVSFKRWKEFLLSYNETYVQDLSQINAGLASLSNAQPLAVQALEDYKTVLGLSADDPLTSGIIAGLSGREFGVSVPRCVWNSDKPTMGVDGYPASPCSPPYGYPLYYKRAQKIGIPEAGVAEIQNSVNKLISNYETLSDATSPDGNFLSLDREDLNERVEFYEQRLASKRLNWEANNPENRGGYALQNDYIQLNKALQEAKDFARNWKEKTKALDDAAKKRLSATKNVLTPKDADGNPIQTPFTRLIANLPRTAKSHLENAQKVYNFVKKVAEDNLGKKFLVKIPKVCNYRYQTKIVVSQDRSDNILAGPFGFAPSPINADPNFSVDPSKLTPVFDQNGNPIPPAPEKLQFLQDIKMRSNAIQEDDLYEHYLNFGINNHLGVHIQSHPANGIQGKTPYTMGALKCNWNPFEEKWEYNYKPEPQGGFFGFDVFPKNVMNNGSIPFGQQPIGVQQGLMPIDMTNLLEDSNRIKCYARYDHSEVLDFTNINADSISQQTIDSFGGVVPDVVELLPNMRPDKKMSFDQISARHNQNSQLDRQAPSVAFVKCEIDEEFYMPPKLQNNNLPVFGKKVETLLSEPPFDIVETQDDDGCPAFKFVVRRITPVFSPAASGGFDSSSAMPQGNQIDFLRKQVNRDNHGVEVPALEGLGGSYGFGDVVTQTDLLDSDHVYALITVPGRIKTTVDQRWADGPMQAFNSVRIKNILTADVVKIPDFFEPSFPEPKDAKIICESREDLHGPGYADQDDAIIAGAKYGQIGAHKAENGNWYPGRYEDYVDFSFEQINEAKEAQKAALKGITLSNPEGGLSFIQPSPIYPDMVAIPLMSWEKCYGPWLSASQLDPAQDARIKYSDIGGKVEFVKDENLAPWNFAGYQLLNEAGKIQANFSNSLLLFSERGGFVIPDAPTGIAIATALKVDAIWQGPLITSLSVDVGQGGVKTTVKMDLYTAQFGKLQKQKEGAISQIAREKQKIKDMNNNAARRGFGKQATNKDLLGGLLKNGGQAIIDLAKGNETFISDAQKKGNPGQVIVLDEVGGAIQTQETIDQFISQYKDSPLESAVEFGKKAVLGIGEIFRGGTNDPHNKNLPNAEEANQEAMRTMILPDDPNDPTGGIN